MSALLIASVVGLIIGALLGLLGGGGSILAVPALVYLLHVDVTQAILVALIVVAAGAAVGAAAKVTAGQVQWRMAAVFAAAGIPATFVGAAIGRLLPQPVVLLGFAAVMIIAGVRMLTDGGDIGVACRVDESGINWRRCAPRSIPAGFAVGLLTGLFGVGGGFLIIPALVVVLGIEMSTAIGTSLLIIIANSVAGIASHLGGITVDWWVTGSFVAAAMATSLVAGYFGTKTDTTRLQRWFAYMVFAVAAYVLVDTLFLH